MKYFRLCSPSSRLAWWEGNKTVSLPYSKSPLKGTGLIQGLVANVTWPWQSHFPSGLQFPCVKNKLVGLFSFSSDVRDLTKQGQFPEVGQQCFLWICKRINSHTANKAFFFGVCKGVLSVDKCFDIFDKVCFRDVKELLKVLHLKIPLFFSLKSCLLSTGNNFICYLLKGNMYLWGYVCVYACMPLRCLFVLF